MNDAATIIHCCGLGREFGSRWAVEALDFTLESGQILALLGPNGAGKTTTMRMLAGLLAPSAGTATVCGVSLATDGQGRAALRAQCGVVPEAPGFYERLSARENLRFFGGLQGLRRRDLESSVDGELEAFGLRARGDDAVATFSKGMKQRLSLARALLHRPRLLLLDEPTAGLDPVAAHELHGRIQTLRASGTSIVLSSHQLEEAEALADVVLMLRTRPLYFGPAQEPTAMTHVEVRTTAMPAEHFVPPSGTQLLESRNGAMHFAIADAQRDVPVLVASLVAAGAAIVAVQPQRRGLREQYLQRLGGM